MDNHITDQTLVMNRKSRKSAEEEYSNIPQKAREKTQEPRHLRSRSKTDEPHSITEDTFIAPRRSVRKRTIKQLFTDMWSFNKKYTAKKVDGDLQEENLNMQVKFLSTVEATK